MKSRTANAAVEQAYSSKIPHDKFPVCVLHIEIAPGAVDVNVHPNKLEVRFQNEQAVAEAVEAIVRDALRDKSALEREVGASLYEEAQRQRSESSLSAASDEDDE